MKEIFGLNLKLSWVYFKGVGIVTNGCEIDKKAIYQIRLRGILDQTWSDWFDNFAIIPMSCGETLLAGQVRDQAALYGLLAKTHSLGLLLLSVNRIEDEGDTKN